MYVVCANTIEQSTTLEQTLFWPFKDLGLVCLLTNELGVDQTARRGTHCALVHSAAEFRTVFTASQ